MIEQVAMELKIPRVIVHSHSTGIDETDEQVREERLIQHNAYKEKFSMEYATDVCACSGMAGDWLFGEQIPREEIRIFPNAIDVKRYRFDRMLRQEMRRKLGLEERTVVGNVGRYCYQKNQEFLLEAFSKAHKRKPDLFLLLIGQGERKKELEEQAEKLGVGRDVCLLGWQENIEAYLQAMDIFCFPSRFEGLGISAIEAQTAGLPCLLSDTICEEVALTDLVRFLPLDVQTWADCLISSINHEIRENREEEIIERGYDIRTAVGCLEKFYEETGRENRKDGNAAAKK